MNSKTAITKRLRTLLAFAFLITGCQFQKPDYVQMISAEELKQVMQNQDIFLIDVHTPQQRHIKGTDLFVPYDEVEKHLDKLPKDKNTAIYIYCRSGPMGNAAAKSLYKLGYRNLFNLEGGAKAWKGAGQDFE
jgi:rhodanese-related sulfurtransferase